MKIKELIRKVPKTSFFAGFTAGLVLGLGKEAEIICEEVANTDWVQLDLMLNDGRIVTDENADEAFSISFFNAVRARLVQEDPRWNQVLRARPSLLK